VDIVCHFFVRTLYHSCVDSINIKSFFSVFDVQEKSDQ
jgi:hypothetical protein